MHDYGDVLKFIDAHKCFSHFSNGDAFFIHKWFFDEYNSLKITIPKHDSIDSALNHHKCNIIEIDNFHINVILNTKGIHEKYNHYALIYLKVQQFYKSSQDNRGLKIINMIISEYFDFISGHILKYNQVIEKLLLETISNIQSDLQKINPDIILEDNHILMYNCSSNDEINVKKYFNNGWHQIGLRTWEYLDKNYGSVKTKVN